MAKKDYSNDKERLDGYLSKIRKLFRSIGDSVSYLHKQNVVHGNLHLQCCGKFDDGWKLTGLIGAQSAGDPMLTSHMDNSVPPESVFFRGTRGQSGYLHDTIIASPAIDIWAFGKLMYEVLVGKPLLPRDLDKDIGEDQRYLNLLGRWNAENLASIVADIENSGNGTLAADLISHCLCQRPDLRPKKMDEILAHPYWSSSASQSRNSASAKKYGSTPTRRFYA